MELKITIPYATDAVAEILEAIVRSAGAQEVRAGWRGDEIEIAASVDAGSAAAAAANWAAVVADFLAEVGYCFPLRRGPTAQVNGARRRANPPAGWAPGPFQPAALAKWRGWFPN